MIFVVCGEFLARVVICDNLLLLLVCCLMCCCVLLVECCLMYDICRLLCVDYH